MATHTPSMPMGRIAAATALCIASTTAWSQAGQEIVITSPLPLQTSDFGDTPLAKAPFSGISIDAQTLRDMGATRISDALRLDASVTDSYNSPAYWDMLSVRGYTLDNRYNFRREGLPISAETMIPMDNKERIELLKGTSGIQAGTSAPGGLANYVVKRAPSGNDETIRAVTATYGNGKSSSIALDLGARFGENKDFGYRFNAAYEDLNPYIRNTQGHRQLMALAMDWRITPDSKLDWEFETSERQQMGVNAYSLLGNTLPAPVDGTLNLSRQPWSVPGVFKANTGSLRFKQNLGEGWLWTTQYGGQRLRTDDRLTFAYGCSAENLWDRFCSNGSFDLYDYRSDNERRISDAFKTEVTGQTRWAGLRHDVGVSFMRQRQLDRLAPMQAYNWAGTGDIHGMADSAANPTPGDLNTNRSEYSNEVAVRDRIALSAQTALWLGLRHTAIHRSSARTDGSRAVQDQRSFNTPWLALSHQITSGVTAYGSYGEGIESAVTANRSLYTNAGQALPALRSQQLEAGLKGLSPSLRWQATYFDITRPQAGDAGTCDGANTCTRQIDGQAHHRGIELGGGVSHGPWLAELSGTWIHAQRENAVIDTMVNGQRALNVPNVVVRALAQYRWADVPGLRTSLRLSHEGSRRVLEDGSITLPAWTTLDLAAHYDTRIQGVRTEWTLAVDNLTDRHYWRESPKQFSHYYLYPGAPRTGRITVRTSF
ncbi:TonB-dependent siderophore receptor [Limnohabitans radicicola]|uniref:TonB-dependent siderophore receptor n=1 Tax=Limnohabitans radicicola TaxID=2771427 RepID=A0A927FIG8_9BURK|nr:TonB-dependent siderophore receptor [Limnohabitans radicicola]MBD8050637.1 TonB-dependent siderophore receptor [Limnohabitans radicicola]